MTIHLGDEFGNEYNASNPVPTSITGSLANIPVELMKSKPTKVEIRGQLIPAGTYYALSILGGSFLASDGIKRVTGGFFSVDTFSNALYVNKYGESGVTQFYGSSTLSVTSKKNGELASIEMTVGKMQVFFYNADTSAHVVDFDLIGWPN